MCTRGQLTHFVILLGVSALVGCASARLEYATSQGYYPFVINHQGQRWGVRDYYCRPQPAISDNNGVAAMNCLSSSELENVRTGRKGDSQLWPQPNAPETPFELVGGYRPVIALIGGQEWFCTQPPLQRPLNWSAPHGGSRVRSGEPSRHATCYSTQIAAEANVKALVQEEGRIPAQSWPWPSPADSLRDTNAAVNVN